MDTSLVIKVFGLGCISIITSLILKKGGKDDIAFVLDIIAVTLVLFIAFKKANEIFISIETWFGL